MYKIFTTIFLGLILLTGKSQSTNTDPTKSYININVPKTPESQAFEKYGAFSVSELTGTPNISIPLYVLKSRFLELPITLSYLPGIKVSQEASWVGLGWDLNVGGRITVETKGDIDDLGVPVGYTPPNFQAEVQNIFHRLGDSGRLGILTYACTCYDCYFNPNTPHAPGTPDDWGTVDAIAKYGLAEPDIFRVNFLGHSFSFYFDIINKQLNFIGEKNLFNISYTTDSYGRIQKWTIVDNEGNSYYFNQTEQTNITFATNSALHGSNTSSTSAWLLTKITHPSGDSILLSYANYGDSYPAYNWDATFTQNSNGGYTSNLADPNATFTTSDIARQNTITQHPCYLTKIESGNTIINFKLGNRTDLNGTGSRRLDSISILDKITNICKQKITFGYDYFIGNVGGCYISADAQNRNNPQRLRLINLTLNDLNNLAAPFKFYYYNNLGQIPTKYCFDQDHWGYYNAANNNRTIFGQTCTPFNMIPLGYGPANTAGSNFTGFANRECNSTVLNVMSLDSMVYPTGGKTEFIYEPHLSARGTSITGGGLRIKSIKNYASNLLAGITDYSYGSGVYMGNIQYANSVYQVVSCQPVYPDQFTYGNTDREMDVLSTTGNLNDNDYLIEYPVVTITQNDGNGNANGYNIKRFNVSAPQYTMYNTGFNMVLPSWPTGIISDGHGGSIDWNFLNNASLSALYAQKSLYAPTPIKELDGKLMQDETYDKTGKLLRSINHFYHQESNSNKFYDIKVKDNTVSNGNWCGGGPSDFSFTSGARRYTMFVSPAKSFFTVEDSIVDLTYDGNNFLKDKKVYQYNSYYQPMFESNYNSDGTQTITYTQTSASLTPNYPLGPLGDAVLLQALKSAHIYDLPIEQTVIHRGTAGDSTVTSSKLNIYKNALPLKMYVMETAQPLTFRSQFVPAFYNYTNYPNSPGGSSDSLKMDTHYKLYSTADYSAGNLIKTVHGIQGNSAYVWDESYNNMLAQCTNADSANIAFTSFETAATGKWTYSAGGIIADPSSPTGNNAFSLSTGVSVTTSSLTSATSYIVSYWSKTGASFTVTGSTSVKQGKSINGWTYFEHTVTGTTSVSISGSGRIDEVRLYPSRSQMISYTYSPLVGITSQCDVDNRITYYFYDSIGRLKWIKDQDGNIIKTIQYHFKGLAGAQF